MTIGVGAVIGAYARYYMEQVCSNGWSIFIINTFACLLMGGVLGYFSVSSWSATHKELFHLLVLTGFSGGLATFSHYIYYCIEYFNANQYLASAGYFIGSLVAGFAFMLGGYWLGAKL